MTRPHAATSEAGFTLLEVLVATAVTMTMIGLTMQAYMGALNANEAVHLLSDTNQNLQVGMTYIQQDLMKAGQSIPTGGLAVPSGSGATAPVAPGPGGRALTAGSVLWSVVPGNASGDLVSPTGTARTDVITVAYIDEMFPTMTMSAIASDASDVTIKNDGSAGSVQINGNTPNKIAIGDVLVLNAGGNILHEVTSIDGANPQKLYFSSTLGAQVTKFNQPNAPTGGLVTLKGGTGAMPAPSLVTARKLKLMTYYIDATNTAHPVLMRRVNARPAEAIGLDVENLQFTYDYFQTSQTKLLNSVSPADPSTVRKINVYLAGRSDVKLRQTNRYIRNSSQTQVTIRSLGLSDAYQ